MSEGPLHGLRVLELASGAAGPFCARLLADYGAEVIKLEPPTGDPLRELSPEWFAGLNTNKRSMAVDVGTEHGGTTLARLIAEVDVLVEDLAGAELGALEAAMEAAPASLVRCSVTPFGRSGPRSEWKGGDLVCCAAAGLAYITGDPDREPLVPGGHQALHFAGLSAFSATLIALWHALHSGEGQHVDVSVQAAIAIALECEITPFQMEGHARTRMGTLHPAVHGVGMQRLADGEWLFVGTLPQLRMWESVKALMGEPLWAQDPRWHDPHLRRRHAEEIDAMAAPVFATLSTEDIYPAMKSARVPVGLVRNMASLHAQDGQLSARGFFVEGPDGDRRSYPGPPWRMSASSWSLRTAAPARCENDSAYTETNGAVASLSQRRTT